MPDVRLPAQEFFVVPYPPLAEDGNDHIARYGGKPKIEGWAHAKHSQPEHAATMRRGFRQTLIKHHPSGEPEPILHVDPVAESRRRSMERSYQALNDGMGASAATWLRNRHPDHPANSAPYRSAGANHPPRTARGLLQNLRPGETRPRSASGQIGPNRDPLYTGRGQDDRGPLLRDLGGGGKGLQALPEEFPWGVTWPAAGAVATDRPVAKREPPLPRVDGHGEALGREGLGPLFGYALRRGNRERARRAGEGGIFRGEDGGWLKRMWKHNAWATPGGIRGSMAPPVAGGGAHAAVSDGWARGARMGSDGWGRAAWPAVGSHYDAATGASNRSREVTVTGRRPASRKGGRPVELQPGCWREHCR